jgi:lysine 2,3-aminomutase
MKSRTLRSAADLAAAGLIAPARLAAISRVARKFELAVPGELAGLIRDAADPIGKQFIPASAEMETASEELADPIGDEKFSPVKGIVHRYPDRVLLKPSHLCPVYCRFCFRREQVGRDGEKLTARELEAALDYIRANPQIWEVIVTGGDPFLLSPRRLRGIVRDLDAIPHLGVIRFHSRMPILSPRAITPALVKSLEAKRAVYVVVHANHPKELTPSARAACANLIKAGIPLLSQSVLLKGVNDDAATLEKLFRDLVAMRIKPYYLHHADMARGTAHFRVPLAEGRELMKKLRGRVSGLCQPSYVLDLPGGFGKVPVGPCYARSGQEPHQWLIEDMAGNLHCYPPGTASRD